VRDMLKRHAEKAGIGKRVHPHGFRHTHAAELAREGVPLHVIRRQLGHSDLAVTARYIDHLAPEEVVAAIRAREWTPV
jgi:integrase